VFYNNTSFSNKNRRYQHRKKENKQFVAESRMLNISKVTFSAKKYQKYFSIKLLEIWYTYS